ncbi:Protein NO VEIN (Protein EMBRYO DEFECTIVE 2597), partial [Durusdinium trenchii]
ELPSEGRWKEFFGEVKLKVSRDGGETWELEHWLLLRRLVKVPDGLTKPGISHSPPSTLLELALPLDETGGFQRGRGAQQVFAFLPVRSYGLPFALQADWAVSSSREDILSGCAWNEFLKAQLPDLILTLVSSVKSLETPLKWSFYSAVPATSSAGSVFRPAIVQLQGRLRGTECILTDDGTFCLPQKALRCPPEARRCLGPESPLRQALQKQGLHLLHEKVETFAPAGLLDGLGVLRLNASQLLRLLPCVEDFPGMIWWRQLLALLDELLDLAPKNDVSRLLEVARQLPLLPRQGFGLEVCHGLVLPPEPPEAY